jgi:AraC-like DNA-binding protein
LYYLITVAKAELTFLYGESVPNCTHRIDKHFVGYHTLQYMSGGGVSLSIGGRPFELFGRWFWSAYPGPRIAFCAAAGYRTWRHRYIAFKGPLVQRWTSAGLFPIEPQAAPHGDDYGDRFDALLRAATRPDKWSRLRAAHLLEGLLIDLADARAHAQEHPSWLKRAMELLSSVATGSTDGDYHAIAAKLGMAESTLRRRFRDATGVPPHEFVLQARVNEARRLLGETNDPIKLIAQKLGYRDVYFFSRQFRQFAGVPPALYRKSRQG